MKQELAISLDRNHICATLVVLDNETHKPIKCDYCKAQDGKCKITSSEIRCYYCTYTLYDTDF